MSAELTGIAGSASPPVQPAGPAPRAQGAPQQAAGTFVGPQGTASAAPRPGVRPPAGPEAENANRPSPGIERPAMSMDEAVQSFKEFLDGLPSDLRFKFHEGANRTVFKVVNPVTNEVVKQYPPDEFLEMVTRLKEASENIASQGIFLEERS